MDIGHEIPVRCRGIAVVLIKKIEGVDKILLMRRATSSLRGAWCYIGGGVKEGEKASEAAFREIQEETGITKLNLYSANCCEQFYEMHRDSIWIAPVFVGYVDSSEDVHLNWEHDDYGWVTIKEASEKATFPGNDKIFMHIDKHFIKQQPTEWLKIDV